MAEEDKSETFIVCIYIINKNLLCSQWLAFFSLAHRSTYCRVYISEHRKNVDTYEIQQAQCQLDRSIPFLVIFIDIK